MGIRIDYASVTFGGKEYRISLIIGVNFNMKGEYNPIHYYAPGEGNLFNHPTYGEGISHRDCKGRNRTVIWGNREADDQFTDWFYGN